MRVHRNVLLSRDSSTTETTPNTPLTHSNRIPSLRLLPPHSRRRQVFVSTTAFVLRPLFPVQRAHPADRRNRIRTQRLLAAVIRYGRFLHRGLNPKQIFLSHKTPPPASLFAPSATTTTSIPTQAALPPRPLFASCVTRAIKKATRTFKCRYRIPVYGPSNERARPRTFSIGEHVDRGRRSRMTAI